jgi:hypothetical protein
VRRQPAPGLGGGPPATGLLVAEGSLGGGVVGAGVAVCEGCGAGLDVRTAGFLVADVVGVGLADGERLGVVEAWVMTTYGVGV